MNHSIGWRGAGLGCGLAMAVLVLTAPTARSQGASPGPPSSSAPAPNVFVQTFPSRQRPPGDPAVIARGQALFGINCKSCHGSDLRGGDLGGPNLLRSQVVLSDQNGEAITPIVQKGRPPAQGGPPMPAFPLPVTDIQAVVAYIHSVASKKASQGGPPPGEDKPLNILVGNPARGKTYFAGHCQSCHSATGDLAGIATRAGSAPALQDNWVAGRRPGPTLPGATTARAQVRVVLANGDAVGGTLNRIDDFTVSLTTAQGEYRGFTRGGPQGARDVELKDPLGQHRQMLTQYTDQDMHDVTAYLATLK
jgi:cytochrome c oxidase cbb3-type subunit III